MPNKNLQAFAKLSQKYVRRFTNYTKNQKAFSLFLMVFAFVLVAFPLVKIAPVVVSKNGQPTMADAGDVQSIYLLGKTYFRSMLIIFSSLIFLL